MTSLGAKLKRFTELAAAAMFAAMFGAFMIQIISRYVFDAPVSWSLEICSITYVWVVFWACNLLLTERQHIVYAGDSPNDAPMFAFFPNAVGVANVVPYQAIMTHLPRYVTPKEGGDGFAELAQALLEARHG